jgi:3-oxoacyl-[acyl-carrier-protein] synthase II
MREVVITGIGCVTPIGTGVEGLWAGLKAKRSAVRTITRFDPTPFKSHVAAEIDDFTASDHLPEKAARRLDRFSQLGVTSAVLAVADASLDIAGENRDRIGVMMGSALGGVAEAEFQVGTYMHLGLKHVAPTLATAVFGGAVSCNIAIQFGIAGPNATNGMSCASGTIGVGDAFHAIRDGRADVMLAGGAEAPLAPLSFGAFTLIRAMSTRNDDPATASRPFDKGRDGFVMGEGAAVLVLEEKSRAVARGARIYAQVLGYALTNDGYHMSAPKPDGREATRAVRLALEEAHVAPHEIEYVNAHGSSTPLTDSTETSAFKQVFGEHAYQLAISGTKGYYAHPLGASGAIEAGICALGMHRGWLPPTVNLGQTDPECDLNFLANGGLDHTPEFVVSNSFGFGGVNAALVLRRP